MATLNVENVISQDSGDTPMQQSLFDELKSYIGFGPADAERLRKLAALIDRAVPGVVVRFYDELLRHPTAREVFTGGDAQLERQRRSLAQWMRELFTGRYDATYYERRVHTGRIHVDLGLPQRYLFLGMELIRQELTRVLQEAGAADADVEAVNRILALDLTIMLESYVASYAALARSSERAEMEEKLTRTEHLAEIGQLAASLAHEIKNPLAGISGAIQIIGDAMAADNPHRGIVGEILGQINRLDAAVRDLLLFARPSRPNLSRTALDKLVSRVLAVLREEPEILRVRVEQINSIKDATVYADEGQIEQLLINLILNAAHASPDGGIVRIKIEATHDGNRVTIQDFGVGMERDVLDHALEPFFTTKARGTGLGLPICRRIVEVHGGRISLRSEPGRGTSVTVELPTETDAHQLEG